MITSDEAKAYVQQRNGQDLVNIDVNSPTWTKFAVFASDPENQAMLVSGGLLAKDLVQLAKATVTNLSQGGIPFAIKSMQVGLRNPQQVDQLKNDMVSGNYKFTAPEGRIAGYVDSKGEDPTDSTIGAGIGSIIGCGIGSAVTEQLKPFIKEGSAEVIGAVAGSTG